MLCQEWTLLKQFHTGIVHAAPLKCKCWHCELCAPMRQRQLRKLARAGRPTTFITLTVNPSMFESAEDRAVQLVNAWRNVRKAMKRRWKMRRIPFLAVFEKTKAGEPHLHILCRLPFVQQAWLSAQMQRLIGAPVVDIRRVTSEKRAAYYVSKYCSKDAVLWPGCKRYWRSLDWCDKKDIAFVHTGPQPYAYHRDQRAIWQVLRTYTSVGWSYINHISHLEFRPPRWKAPPC